MTFCVNCGTQLDDGSRFCAHCGAKIGKDGEAAARETPVQAVNSVPSVQPTAQSYTFDAGTTKQNKNAWQYFCDVWKKYAVFRGRARRAEYWWFHLFNVIIAFDLGFIDGYMGLYVFEGVGILFFLYFLASFIPGWSVMVRRFHDVNNRAWFVLVPLCLFVVFCAGTRGANRFGPDPKQQ
jgi:uncharacterized membrane protein YhaH (DUF805 family)